MADNGHVDVNNPEQFIEDRKLKEAFEKATGGGGATIGLQLEGEDGILTRQQALSGSLLRQLVTVDVEHYENEIKTGNYSSPKEARLFAAALYEAETLGMNTKLIKYIHMANNAGTNRDLANEVMRTLTHSEFTFRNGKPNDSRKSKSTPLS